MRIILCINSLKNGGAERVMVSLANYLADLNHEIFLLTIGSGDSFYELGKRIELIQLDLNYPSKNPLESLRNLYLRVKNIGATFRAKKPDLCISFMTETNIMCLVAGLYTKVPIIISERTNPQIHSVGHFYNLLRKVLYKRSKALIVQTTNVKKFYVDSLNLQNVKVIPNPINLKRFSSNTHFYDREKKIINVGRLTQEKGHKFLIDSYAESDAVKLGWSLHIIGDGPLQKALQTHIKTLGLEEHIFLLGSKENVNLYLKNAGLYILSSQYEGFPNALMEALAVGVPCLTSNCDYGPSDLIIDGLNGILVENGNVTDLKEKINMLLKNAELREKFSRAGPKSMEKFEDSLIMNRWYSLLKETIAH